MESHNLLSDRIRRARDHLGETQKSISKRYNLGEKTWQLYELQGRPPNGEVLTALAGDGININWLLTGVGEMLVDRTLPRDGNQFISEDLIIAAVVAIEEWLAERKRTLSPELKGKVVALLIEEALDESDDNKPRVNRASAGRILRLVS